MNKVLLVACAVGAITCAASAARAAPLAGRYSSPLGPVQINEKNGDVTGTVLDGKNPCGLKKGAVVLQGSRLDDSIVGTVHACKVGDGCAGALEGAAMLLITKNGAVISGAVHLEPGACKTPIAGNSIVFRRAAGAAAPKTTETPVVSPTGKKTTARERAEALAREAEVLLTQAEGNAEGARQKLMDAIKIDPEYAEGYLGIGVTYFARDRYDEALDWYKRALEVNPGLGDAYYNIACVYAVRGDRAQALRYLRIALLNGYVQLATLSSDPDLQGLHGDPTFERFKLGDTTLPDTTAPAPNQVAPVDAGPVAPGSSPIDRAPGQ